MDQKCKNDDQPVITYKWSGMRPMCYGEDVTFEDKRNNRNTNYPMKYYVGTCAKNRYGKKKQKKEKEKRKKTIFSNKWSFTRNFVLIL